MRIKKENGETIICLARDCYQPAERLCMDLIKETLMCWCEEHTPWPKAMHRIYPGSKYMHALILELISVREG